MENPSDGNRLTFGYMGGYGWNNREVTPTNGWRRLAFAYSLAWLQQTVEPDLVTGQHANQYPIIEVYQALKAYNNDPANEHQQLTMLDALVGGTWVNYLEKRYAVATNAITETDPRNQSIENYGPFKPGREQGAEDARVRLVDGGLVLHGYQGAQNVNPRVPLLRDGIVIGVDNFVPTRTAGTSSSRSTCDDSVRRVPPRRRPGRVDPERHHRGAPNPATRQPGAGRGGARVGRGRAAHTGSTSRRPAPSSYRPTGHRCSIRPDRCRTQAQHCLRSRRVW